MEEDSRKFEEMEEEVEKIRSECEHFDMEPPDFAALAEVGADIDSTKKSWGRYSEFTVERTDMGQKDWISFRKNHYQLEDMLTKWAESVKGTASKDAVAVVLLSEIDKYRKCLPYLKFVRGDGWEVRKHGVVSWV